MATNGSSASDGRSSEERAEELVERIVTDGSRVVGRLLGRMREELDDIVAEARTVRERWDRPNR